MAQHGLCCTALPRPEPQRGHSRVTSRPPVLEAPRGWDLLEPQDANRGVSGINEMLEAGLSSRRGCHSPRRRCVAVSRGHVSCPELPSSLPDHFFREP